MRVTRCFLFLAILFGSALTAQKILVKPGQWRGALQLNDTAELPFTFTIDWRPTEEDIIWSLTVVNGTEKIDARDFRFDADSVWWTMPVFNTKFRCKRETDTTFSGEWSNTAASKPYVLKFRAEYGKPRFNPPTCTGACNFDGKFECWFSPGTSDSSKAVGLFTMAANGSYQGTFLTETGDYRYLEGGYTTSDCCELALSCFDGQHAFLFRMRLKMDTVTGEFWSGKYWHEPWKAKRNPKFELRDPEKLTWITDSSNVNFTFNDLNGKPVSLSDPQFKGKVVVIQIMGSWCPNCMDETAWMAGVYDKYHSQGLEVVALAYERKGDTATQNAAIRRVRDRYNAKYTFLNTEKSGKDSASASLPFLNGIMGFPTSIYIDRSGNVRKIYTGFNGPATGAYYTKDTEEALRFIQQLLAEKPKQ
jgi:thiol-disulfide isomerase/thioredoxin